MPLCNAFLHCIRYHGYNAEEGHWRNLCNISAMHFRGTSNMLVVILDVTIESGLIGHAVPGSGCVVPVLFDMFWMSRSVVTESV